MFLKFRVIDGEYKQNKDNKINRYYVTTVTKLQILKLFSIINITSFNTQAMEQQQTNKQTNKNMLLFIIAIFDCLFS